MVRLPPARHFSSPTAAVFHDKGKPLARVGRKAMDPSPRDCQAAEWCGPQALPVARLRVSAEAGALAHPARCWGRRGEVQKPGAANRTLTTEDSSHAVALHAVCHSVHRQGRWPTAVEYAVMLA